MLELEHTRFKQLNQYYINELTLQNKTAELIEMYSYYLLQVVAFFVHIHPLRHTLATHLLERGLSLSAIARILGHEDLRTTAKYIHYTSEVKQSSVLLPNDVIDGLDIHWVDEGAQHDQARDHR